MVPQYELCVFLKTGLEEYVNRRDRTE